MFIPQQKIYVGLQGIPPATLHSSPVAICFRNAFNLPLHCSWMSAIENLFDIDFILFL